MTAPQLPDSFRVEVNGETHALEPTLADLIRYERKYGDIQDPAVGFPKTPEQVAYLIWLMCSRTKVVGADVDFEAFLDAMGKVEPVRLPKARPKKRSPASSPRQARTGARS